jgi:hypothetical protein
LNDLGLGNGMGLAAMTFPEDTAPERDADIGGLRQALMDRDTHLGLGPGGKIADEVRKLTRDLAPVDSRATLIVSVDPTGAVTDISLREATDDTDEWSKVLRILRAKITEILPWRGGAVRVTLAVHSVSAPRSGPSSRPFSFDVSNIGSSEIHHLHVQVLEQVRP